MSQQNSGISKIDQIRKFSDTSDSTQRGGHTFYLWFLMSCHTYTSCNTTNVPNIGIFGILVYFVHCKNTRDAFVPSIQRMIDLVWRSKKRTDAALTKVDIVPCFTDSRQPASCPSVFSHPTSHPHTLFVKGDAVRGTFQNFVLAKGIPQTTTEGRSLAVNVPLKS